eukprot:8988153-Ditylum_brightwellii.AAC.1
MSGKTIDAKLFITHEWRNKTQDSVDASILSYGESNFLSGFYGETTSSKCKGDYVWGLPLLNSERLVAEIGDKTVPPLADQSLSILKDMIEEYRNGSYKNFKTAFKQGSYKKITTDIVPNYTGNMV